MVRPAPKRADKHEHDHDHQEGSKCYCPYCNIEVKEDMAFCTSCGKNLKQIQQIQ
ncbi:MAG: zinc-ribbon domain-containing protein [Thermodesulfobacteriota bacterium]